MTCAELYEWMADPSLLNKSTLQELRQMMDEYPYFHPVRLLYLKNLAVVKDVRLEKELKKMSVFVPDRRLLYHLINEHPAEAGKRKEQKPPASGKSKTTTEIAFDIIEKAIPEDEPDEQEYIARYISKPVTSQMATLDYTNWLAQNVDDIPTEDGTANRLKHQELIDSFISTESNQFAQRKNQTVVKNDAETANENEPLLFDPKEKISLDDSYFTETLARVYIGQKRYDKALEIIRVLSLKYPQKNRYFADQIRYLEKIINLKK